MLTAYDVLNQKFAATTFREGYDQDEVDTFLDRVSATLQGLERGQSIPGAVTAEEVGTVQFQSSRFREGYNQDEVDRFLARVREQLTTPAPEDVPVWQPAAASGVSALTATALVMRLQSAYSTRPPGAPDVVTVQLPDGQAGSVVDVRSTPTGIELVLG